MEFKQSLIERIIELLYFLNFSVNILVNIVISTQNRNIKTHGYNRHIIYGMQ